MNRIIHGDCLDVLGKLHKAKPKMIFADPPDNCGVKYKGFTDDIPDYERWLWVRLWYAWDYLTDILWVSYFHRHQAQMLSMADEYELPWRQFIWRFTFGQHRQNDCGNGYRPILRLMRPSAKLYPDAIREPSARQTKYRDKRANPKGRVPDDVWEYPRVCGTFKERKKWHPCQHPKALLRRIVLFSTKPGDLVIDMFAGSGNMLEVCKELKRDCIGIEISRYYCNRIAKEQEIKVE